MDIKACCFFLVKPVFLGQIAEFDDSFSSSEGNL